MTETPTETPTAADDINRTGVGIMRVNPDGTEERIPPEEFYLKPSEMEERVAKAICCPHSECRRKSGCTALCIGVRARAVIALMAKAKSEQQRGLRFSAALERMRDGLSMRRAAWPDGLHVRIPENVMTFEVFSSNGAKSPWWPLVGHILNDDWEVYDD